MRKIRHSQVEIDENATKRRKKKGKCPTLNFFFQALFMYTHCIFHGVRWNSAAAVIVVAFLCYIYTHTHTCTHSRCESRTYKNRYTHGIPRCLNNKWKFATLSTHIHSYKHTQCDTDTFSCRLLMMEKLTSQKKKRKTLFQFYLRNGAQIHNAFRFVYRNGKSAFREKKKHVHWNVSLDDVVGIAKEIIPKLTNPHRFN